ncbi:MAG: YceH family protein [Gemmatimonadetes bacterium]|nr:YceH family protein [Gemmatimonadota bacterium]
MHPPLTDIEVRILGALAEKCVTTPDNYPLSLASLTAACNQATNRDPVMRLDEQQVTESIVGLRRRSLLRAIQPAGSRVTKFQHLLDDALTLDARKVGLLGVLMLRGAQTSGELHTRTARVADFADRAAVELTLDALIAREPEPLVMRIPRTAGQKEDRFAHLLAGDVVGDLATWSVAISGRIRPPPTTRVTSPATSAWRRWRPTCPTCARRSTSCARSSRPFGRSFASDGRVLPPGNQSGRRAPTMPLLPRASGGNAWRAPPVPDALSA